MRRRFQRGRLVLRNVVWYGQFWDDGPEGRRVRRWVRLGCMSEREARKQFQPYLDRVNSQPVAIPPKLGATLADFVKEWRRLIAPQKAPSYVRSMESHLRAHILPKLGRLALPELTTRVVQEFVSGSAWRSRKTAENVVLTLSSLTSTAKDWNYKVGDWSFSKLVLPEEGVVKERKPFTDAELRQIIAAAPEPLHTVLLVLAVLGLRIGEALGLRVEDLDFEQRVVRIRQSVDSTTRLTRGLKSKASRADLPMPDGLAIALKTYLEHRGVESELVFVNRKGRPLSANKLRAKKLYPLLDRLGMPRRGFHAVRHSVASALLAEGATPAVVQRQLRHSDPRITLGVYAHVVGDQQRAAVEKRAAQLVN